VNRMLPATGHVMTVDHPSDGAKHPARSANATGNSRSVRNLRNFIRTVSTVAPPNSRTLGMRCNYGVSCSSMPRIICSSVLLRHASIIPTLIGSQP
jgi:hypothetical protein